jgi:hypothetical protein
MFGMNRGPRVSQESADLVTVDHRTQRWMNMAADLPGPMRPRVAPHGIGDRQSTGYQQPNDALIERDNTPHQHIQYAGNGTLPFNDWVHSGPPRPSWWIQSDTISPRQGAKNRWLQNPAAPGTGLHTYVVNNASGAIGSADRFTTAGVPKQRSRRQNRLSPSRYSGQSFSQTTNVQGG